MALDWSTIKSEHVTKACELIVKGSQVPRVGAKGLCLAYQDQRLPAKHVVRLAYCLANGLSFESKLKFASGEGTIRLLHGLGFEVVRLSSTNSPGVPQ